MKKMLIVLAALTVMGAGFATAEEQKTEPKEPSQAYMYGYNKAVAGEKNTCNNDYGNTKSPAYSQRTKNSFECNQGYRQAQADNNNASNQQPTGN